MSTFGYDGDDSNLDSETDTDSNTTAYPFLDENTQQKVRSHSLSKRK